MKAKHISIFTALLLSLIIPISASPTPIIVGVTFSEGTLGPYDPTPSRIAELERLIPELKEEIAELEDEIAELEEQIAELEDELADMLELEKELDDLLDELRDEIAYAWWHHNVRTPYTGTHAADPAIPPGGWAVTPAVRTVFATAIATAEGILTTWTNILEDVREDLNDVQEDLNDLREELDDLQEELEVLQDKLEELEELLYELRNTPLPPYELYGIQLERGESFSLTVSLEANDGFTGMPLRFNVPPGIELVSITPHHTANFQQSAILDGEFFLGWAGGTVNDTTTGEIATIDLRVVPTATLTTNAALTMAFAYAADHLEPPRYATPTNAEGEELNFTLPGVPTATPARQIARITIVETP